jgi:predicted dehydrogenase
MLCAKMRAMQKVRWGIIGVANIATQKVIPAMQKGQLCDIVGIASRDRAKAQEAAGRLGIPKAYGSYEEMFADPEIEAVYNPLPNHLHVPVSIQAAEAGKHVLCEKPLGMDVADVLKLIAVRDRTGVVMGEAFMVRTHPQWLKTIEMVRAGRIGQLKAAMGSFGYFNDKVENIRNIRKYGGGALMDIGCYPIKTSRMVFGEEPVRVSGAIVRDPRFHTDILTSGILEYPSGHCVFTCSTQMVPNQRMQFYGTTGRIQLDIPFNAIPGQAMRILVDNGSDLLGAGITTEEVEVCDQYTLQGDQFSHAVREHKAPPVPLEDSARNMAVIDALFRSAESGHWEQPATAFEASAG